MNVIPTVLWQHAVEASILWLRRDRAVAEPHFCLDDLPKLDRRLEANLDALFIAESTETNAAWEICERELAWHEPGEVFVAASMALHDHDEKRLRKVFDVAGHSYELCRALVSALGWSEWDGIVNVVHSLLDGTDPTKRYVGIAASAVHRREVQGVLAKSIEAADEWVRYRAVRAVGELGHRELLEAARAHIHEESVTCRRAAAWSVALLAGEGGALDELQRVVEAGNDRSNRALQVVLRRLRVENATAWLSKLGQEAERIREVCIGTGVLGIPDSIPWLLDLMDVPPLARVAGEAFTMITGLSLDSRPFEADWPEGFRAGPTEDPADDRVALDPDENLPWPNREAVSQWWVKHRDEFQSQTRYLLGRPIEEGWCEHVLRAGNQRQRAAAALELAIRRPSEPLFEVRAPGKRQLASLGL